MDQIELLAVFPTPLWQLPSALDLGESINDTKIICAEREELLIERSFLCWSSKVFWRMFASGVGKVKRENDLWILELPDDERKIVNLAYQISKRLMVRLLVSYENKLDDQAMVDLIHFAYKYEFVLLLDLLKRIIIGLVEPCFSRPKQCYFELDQQLNFGLRPYLLKAWVYQTLLLREKDWEKVEVFEDITIYQELFQFLFLKLTNFLSITKRVRRMLIGSFILSGLDFLSLSEEIRTQPSLAEQVKVFVELIVEDPEKRKDILETYKGIFRFEVADETKDQELPAKLEILQKDNELALS
jgi:hypothetical protein